jgi:hypothetical protein
MAAVKFPARIVHCHSSLSEFNISFDVYSDTSGLQYWLHEEDSKWGKKGDLFQIVYGPKRRPFPSNALVVVISVALIDDVTMRQRPEKPGFE